MALQAKCPHVGKVALSPTFRNRYDVVGIPKRLPAFFAKPPFFEKSASCREVQPAHVSPKRHRVCAAFGADSAIALQNFFAQIAGVGSEFPLVNAGTGTKRPTARRSFRAAPAAQRAARFAVFDVALPRPPARFRPGKLSAWKPRAIFRRQRGLTSPMPKEDSTTRLAGLTIAVAAKPDCCGVPNLRSISDTRRSPF